MLPRRRKKKQKIHLKKIKINKNNVRNPGRR